MNTISTLKTLSAILATGFGLVWFSGCALIKPEAATDQSYVLSYQKERQFWEKHAAQVYSGMINSACALGVMEKYCARAYAHLSRQPDPFRGGRILPTMVGSYTWRSFLESYQDAFSRAAFDVLFLVRLPKARCPRPKRDYVNNRTALQMDEHGRTWSDQIRRKMEYRRTRIQCSLAYRLYALSYPF